VKNRPKTRLLGCQIAKILALLRKIAVAEYDGIQTRYKFNTVSKKTANINVKKLDSLKLCLKATRPTSHN